MSVLVCLIVLIIYLRIKYDKNGLFKKKIYTYNQRIVVLTI